MKTSVKAIIVVAVAALAAAAVAAKRTGRSAQPAAVAQAEAVAKLAMPRLVDLGAGKCIPCKMMAPILEELKKEYATKFAVEFIDVWENPTAQDKYDVNVIPTQIFYDAGGKELWRHEGFISKEDILAKWRELGEFK